MEQKKAKGVKLLDKDVLEVREGLGIFLILGLAALVPGLFMLFANDGDPNDPAWVFKLISIPFLLTGAGILLMRSGYTFDRQHDKIEKWWGIVAPFSRKNYGKLSDYRRIAMTRVQTGKGRNERIEYPVWLETEGSGGVKMLSLMREKNYKRTRAQVEAIAHFLGITFLDTAG